ncbi:MAG: bifunctional riboflavin kinase/FAD synthetase [bacterium]
MLQIKSLSKIPKALKKSTVTIGAFDSLHSGHKKLIMQTIKQAKKIKGQSVLFTFAQHPDKTLKKDSDIKLISHNSERLKILKNLGVDIFLNLDFSQISGMSAETFVRKVLLEKLKMKWIIAGRDFVFGKKAKGNMAFLKKMGAAEGFKAKTMDTVKVNGVKVSDTAIREYLRRGDIKMADKMLGRQYEIYGKVAHGRHIGFKLGFPTANIKMTGRQGPALGVWAVRVKVGNLMYTGAANVGTAPTIKNESHPLIEIFILDFNKKIYGRKIAVVFLEKIRDEKKFKNTAQLITRVKKDIEIIKRRYCEK